MNMMLNKTLLPKQSPTKRTVVYPPNARGVKEASSLPSLRVHSVTPITQKSEKGIFIDEMPKSIILSANHSLSNVNVNKKQQQTRLPATDDPTFQNVFKQKIEICKCNTTQDTESLKSSALHDILDFVNSEKQVISSLMINDIVDVIQINVFNQDPIDAWMTLKNNYTIKVFDPNWPHISICMQIFTKLFQLYPNHPFFSKEIISKLFYLMGIPDVRERNQYAHSIRVFAFAHPEWQDYIIMKCFTTLNEVTQNILPPYCVTPVIALISYFAKNISGKQLFTYAFPLCKSQYLPLFVENIQALVLKFSELVPCLPVAMIKYIKTHWPTYDALKQVCLVRIIFSCLRYISHNDQKKQLPDLFCFLAELVNKPLVRVAEASLLIFTDEIIRTTLKEHLPSAIQAYQDDIMIASTRHWFPQLQAIASKIRDDYAPAQSKRVRLSTSCLANSPVLMTAERQAEKVRLTNWLDILEAAISNGEKDEKIVGMRDKIFKKLNNDGLFLLNLTKNRSHYPPRRSFWRLQSSPVM